MDAFGWLGQLGDAFVSLLPQAVLVRTTQGGLAWWFGRYTHRLSPGIYLLWPVVCDWEILPVCDQTIALHSQRLMTRDGVPLLVGGWAGYEIGDAAELLRQLDDPEEVIRDHIADAIACVVCSSSFEHLKNRDDVSALLRDQIELRLSKYTVKVLRCALSDVVEANFVLGTWGTE